MGGVLGWSLDQLYSATVQEALLAFRGWQRANGVDPDDQQVRKAKPMTRDRYEALKEQAEIDKALKELAERNDPKHAEKYATKYTFVGC